MSGYVKNLKLVIPFDGDEVTLILRQLEWADFRTLTSVDGASDTDILLEWAKLLPKYVVEMRGLSDAAGTPVTLAEVATVAYFYPIVGKALRFVMDQAVLKNLKASGETSTAPSSEADPLTVSEQADTAQRTG